MIGVTIARVLPSLYKAASKTHGANVDAEVLSRTSTLNTFYFSFSKSTWAPLDYDDPVTRFLYAYKYIAGHADVISKLLAEVWSDFKPDFLRNDPLDVCCVGGGPGTDMLGVAAFLDSQKRLSPELVRFAILEKEQAWAPLAEAIADALPKSRDYELDFLPSDATTALSGDCEGALGNADIVIMSFLISEIATLSPEQYLAQVIKSIRTGCIILITDIGTPEMKPVLDSLSSLSRTELLASEDLREFRFARIDKDFEPYLTRLNHHYPKSNPKVAYRVLRKV